MRRGARRRVACVPLPRTKKTGAAWAALAAPAVVSGEGASSPVCCLLPRRLRRRGATM